MENFQVLLTGPEFVVGPPVIKDQTILSNGNQKFAPGHSSFSYKIKIPAYIFSIKNPKSGVWSLTFERKPGYQKPLVVIVRATNSKPDQLLKMHSWIENDAKKGSMFNRPPIKFFTKLDKGNTPASNATVSAVLYKPDSGEEIAMTLFDNGDGDPDITKNDGIYARYFSEIPKSGYYILTVTAESNWQQQHLSYASQGSKPLQCCGSSFPPESLYASEPFKRIVTFGSFYVAPELVGLRFPPRRIVDLHVDELMKLNNQLAYVLKWTAPGNNYDYGTAIEYQLRVFKERMNIWTNFDSAYVQIITNFHVHGRMLEPLPAGTNESVIIELKNLTSGIYYLAMRTVNSAGEFSDVSNIVEIGYQEPTSDPNNKPTRTSTEGDSTATTDRELENSLSRSDTLNLALGITVGILFLMIVIGIIAAIYCRKIRKNKLDEETRQEVISRYGGAPTYSQENIQKAESHDALCHSTNTLNISVISPINSWPANSLISHYESLKRNKNSDSSEASTVPAKDLCDSISLDSSKYSYINKAGDNSTFYDRVYPSYERESISYPYDPTYVPFNPTCTSSLRRPHLNNSVAGQGYSNNSLNFYNYPPERGSVMRLATDL